MLDPTLQTFGTYAKLMLPLTPPWLQGKYGTLWCQGMGIALDNEWQLAHDAAMVGFPEYSPSDALQALGSERMLERIFATAHLPGETELEYRERLKNVWGAYGQPLIAAPATYALHATIAGGAALNVTTGWLIYPISGLVTITLGAGGFNPTLYTLTGLDSAGNLQSEVITATGAGSYVSIKRYASIISLISNVDPVGTTIVTTSGIIPQVDTLDVQHFGLPQGIWEAAGSAAIHKPGLFTSNSTMRGWPAWVGLANTAVYRQHEWNMPPYLVGPTFFAWENKWSTFWVLIRQPHPFVQLLWGAMGLTWGAPLTWGTNATVDEVNLLKRLVVNFKSGHSSCAGIVLQLGTGMLWGDGVWGTGVWGGMGLASIIWPIGEPNWY